MALIIVDNDIVPVEKRHIRCFACGQREAVLRGALRDSEEVAEFCAYCLMYSGQTQWGYDNRDELLMTGMAAKEMAAKHNQPMPVLDERGRLSPDDASKFMMGVVFTSKMVKRFARMTTTERS